jgi:hypothetical protein
LTDKVAVPQPVRSPRSQQRLSKVRLSRHVLQPLLFHLTFQRRCLASTTRLFRPSPLQVRSDAYRIVDNQLMEFPGTTITAYSTSTVDVTITQVSTAPGTTVTTTDIEQETSTETVSVTLPGTTVTSTSVEQETSTLTVPVTLPGMPGSSPR